MKTNRSCSLHRAAVAPSPSGLRCSIAAALCMATLGAARSADAQLFVGLEGGEPVTRSSDLSGFPNITWTDHFAFDVSGAAASPDGTLYL